MTDREKLEALKEGIEAMPESYEKTTKLNVLEKLLVATNHQTGNLMNSITIPIYEHDTEFLKEILTEFGYTPLYEKEYNYFWNTTCYEIKL